jgi:hypothetical protein
MADIKNMAVSAIATTALATVTLTGIAVVQGYRDTGLVDNTTADNFIAGLAIFGTFMTIITLALVGKIIIGLFVKQ